MVDSSAKTVGTVAKTINNAIDKTGKQGSEITKAVTQTLSKLADSPAKTIETVAKTINNVIDKTGKQGSEIMKAVTETLSKSLILHLKLQSQ